MDEYLGITLCIHNLLLRELFLRYYNNSLSYYLDTSSLRYINQAKLLLIPGGMPRIQSLYHKVSRLIIRT